MVDEAFDHAVIDALRRHDIEFFRSAPLHKLMSGSSEIRNWICLAGAGRARSRLGVVHARLPHAALTGTGLCFASFRPGASP